MKISRFSHSSLGLWVAVGFFCCYFFIQHFSTPSLQDSDTIALFSDEERARSLLVSSLKKANQSIYMELFRLTDPFLLALLESKKTEGIFVSLLMDKKGAAMHSLLRWKHLTDSITRDNHSGLMHRKIIVIDEKISWIGSFNMTRRGFHLQKNALLYVKDAEVALFLKNPHQKYLRKTLENTQLSLWKLPPFKEPKRCILETIRGAQKTITALLFVLSHPLFIEELIQAKRRGVQVQIILNRSHIYSGFQQSILQMLEEGIVVYIYQGIKELHHKLVCIDERIFFMGSCNWTKNAFTKNREILMKLDTNDSKLKHPLSECWKKTLLHAVSVAQIMQTSSH